jgi:hypothetical protein
MLTSVVLYGIGYFYRMFRGGPFLSVAATRMVWSSPISRGYVYDDSGAMPRLLLWVEGVIPCQCIGAALMERKVILFPKVLLCVSDIKKSNIFSVY